MKPKYYTVVDGKTDKIEVHSEEGTLIDNLSNQEVARSIAQLAEMRHLARDPESGMLYILDVTLQEGFEVETLEEWIDYCRGAAVSDDDGPTLVSVTNDTTPTMPLQKVGT